MKTLRYMLVGLLIGGGLGSSFGSYLASAYDINSFIADGFLFGGGIGVVLGLSIALFGSDYEQHDHHTWASGKK